MKVKLVISDFHIGKGRILDDGSVNLLEDFQIDQKFIEFLEYYSTGRYEKAEVELIINGDFINLLQVDYQEEFLTKITEQASIYKVESIFKGHSELFDALAAFARGPHKKLTYVMGNHDPGLLWQGVRDLLDKRLGCKVHYPMLSYRFDGIHIEHGCQYEAANRYNQNMFFLFRRIPEPVINLPWASQFVISVLNRLKMERIYIDKIKPFRAYLRWALFYDFRFAIRAITQSLWFFMKNRLVWSRWRLSRMGDTLAIMKESTTLSKLEKFARAILKEGEVRIVIFGHTHQYLHLIYPDGTEYFNTGTWNPIISLDVATLGRNEKLTFVYIEYDGERPGVKLKAWRGHYHVEEDLP